jgi:hypothetical protein
MGSFKAKRASGQGFSTLGEREAQIPEVFSVLGFWNLQLWHGFSK